MRISWTEICNRSLSMKPVSRRRLQRLSLSVALLALLVGASRLALPLAVQALAEWGLGRLGFGDVRVSGVRLEGLGIAIERLALAPNEAETLQLGDVGLRIDLESLPRGHVREIRIGSLILETRIREGRIVVPGRDDRESAERSGTASSASRHPFASFGPADLPFERLVIEESTLVLQRPQSRIELQAESLIMRVSEGAASLRGPIVLRHPRVGISGSIRASWSGGLEGWRVELEIEEGSADLAALDAEGLRGDGRLRLRTGGSPEASLSLEATRTRWAGRTWGAVEVEAGWHADRLSISIAAPGSAGPLALQLDVEIRPASRRFEVSGEARLAQGTALHPQETAPREAGGPTRGRLELSFLGGWQGTWLSAGSGAAEPRVSGRLELRGEGLALDGAWRDGRLDLVGSVEARPRHLRIRAEEPWTARVVPETHSLPKPLAAFESKPLRLSFEPRSPIEATLDGAPQIAIDGALRASSENGARLTLELREAIVHETVGEAVGAQGPRFGLDVGSLSISAERVPVARSLLALREVRGHLRLEEGRARWVGRGRLRWTGGLGALDVEGATLSGSASLTADHTGLALAPDPCLPLSAEAIAVGSLRIEAPTLPCLDSREGKPLIAYHFEDRILEIELASEPAPFSFQLSRDGAQVETVEGEWPATDLRMRGQGGAWRIVDASLRGGRLRLPRRSLELVDLDAQGRLVEGRVRDLHLEIAELESLRSPPLWTPLRLELDGVRESRDEPLSFRATLSDPVGIFVLEAKGRQRERSGEARLTLHPIRFIPDATELADLSPRLAIWVDGLTGEIAFDGEAAWSPHGVRSGGTLRIDDLGLSLTASSLSGIQSRIRLSSLFPPRTPESQEIEIALLDAGVPLTDGQGRFDLRRGPELAVTELGFEMAGGRIRAEPFTVDPTDPTSLQMRLRAEGVELSELVEISGIPGLEGQGRLSGRIPLKLSAEGLRIDEGELGARREGVLRYRPTKMPGFLSGDDLRSRLLREALQNYRYDDLSLSVSGEVADEQQVRLFARGHNPDFLDGHPVELDVEFTGPLVSVLQRTLGGSIPIGGAGGP